MKRDAVSVPDYKGWKEYTVYRCNKKQRVVFCDFKIISLPVCQSPNLKNKTDFLLLLICACGNPLKATDFASLMLQSFRLKCY